MEGRYRKGQIENSINSYANNYSLQSRPAPGLFIDQAQFYGEKMDEEYILEGQCHCGNIGYSLATKIELSKHPVRSCSCSFCVKHGSRYISDPNGELTVCVQSREKIVPYEFGTKTAKFLICGYCGVMPIIVCKMEDRYYGIVNCNTLNDAHQLQKEVRYMDFSTEDLDTRLQRRRKNWIGTVEGVFCFY